GPPPPRPPESRGSPAPPPPGARGAPAAAPPAGPPPAVERREQPVSPREALFLVRRSCGGDVRAYCRGVDPGGGRIIRCLRDNAANLSPDCQDALTSLRRR